MDPWTTWKKGFSVWEKATNEYWEKILGNEAVLAPAGALLTATMKIKAATDKAVAAWWGNMGLATKADQERLLHAVNQLESRLLDLEETLDDEEDA